MGKASCLVPRRYGKGQYFGKNWNFLFLFKLRAPNAKPETANPHPNQSQP